MIVAEGMYEEWAMLPHVTLQWGRNLIVAEGVEVRARAPPGNQLQWGRNLIVAEGDSRRPAGRGGYCFNGAAT